MKKIILTTLAASCLSLGALAQGSVTVGTGNLTVNNPGITSQGVGATSTSAASTWYDGNITYQIWFLAGTNAAARSAVNALDNVTGGAATAQALLGADGY